MSMRSSCTRWLHDKALLLLPCALEMQPFMEGSVRFAVCALLSKSYAVRANVALWTGEGGKPATKKAMQSMSRAAQFMQWLRLLSVRKRG